jgi:hypothetical protein
MSAREEAAAKEGRSPRRMSREAWAVLLLGLLSVAPYLAYHHSFSRLFWFGDEFDQVDLIDRLGFWHWVRLSFGENFMPLFKTLWGGAVLASGGSYAFVLAIGWACHALNCVLLGRLLRACGLSLAAVAFAQIAFGLSPTTYETLAWSIQWCASLSVTFLLLSLLGFVRRPYSFAPSLWAAASALSFVRGVLTGGIVACLALGEPAASGGRGRRNAALVLYLLPSLLAAIVIMSMTEGNHRHFGGHYAEAAQYGLWFFCLNPLHQFLAVESWGWRTVAVLGTAKVLLFAWGLRGSRGLQRRLFVALIAFDVSYSVLLGIGRYHTGLMSSVSSRYQYASLLAAVPIAGFCIDRAWSRIPVPRTLRKLAYAAGLAALGFFLCTTWRGEMEGAAVWRGEDARRILFVEAAPAEYSVPGIPFMPVSRAKELIAKYHLH